MAKKIQRGLLLFPILKDLNPADGILVKNEGIREGFQQNGVEVDMLEFTSAGVFHRGQLRYAFRPARYMRVWQFLFRIWPFVLDLIEKEQYEFLWLRLSLNHILSGASAGFISRLKKRVPHCRIILEYGAYPYVNELTPRQKFFYYLNRRGERIGNLHADFAITYSGQDFVDRLPNIPINNGISLARIPVIHNRLAPGDTLHIISVSSLRKWHAYERLINGLPAYLESKAAQPLHFHIVGNGSEYNKLVALVGRLQLQPHVTFHGFRSGRELDEIYAMAHAAIGTLGFHRVGIHNSSSLKNREYFARGLPIVLSTTDLDMPPGLPFAYYVPEGEAPVEVQGVVEFVRECYLRPDLNQSIRNYADAHISWASKIKTVLTWLEGAAVVNWQPHEKSSL